MKNRSAGRYRGSLRAWLTLLMALALCSCAVPAGAGQDTGAAEAMAESWQQKYGSMLAKPMEKISALVIPDSLLHPGMTADDWYAPETEIPKLTEIAEWKIEDKKLCVTMKSRINNILIIEYNSEGFVVNRYDSYSDKAVDDGGVNGRMPMKSPLNRAEIRTSEAVPSDGDGIRETFYEQVYSLKGREKTLKLEGYTVSEVFPAADYPPYGEKRDNSVTVTRELRTDLTMSRISCDFGRNYAYMDISARFDEDGVLSFCEVLRSCSAGKGNELVVRVGLDGKGKTDFVNLQLPGEFTLHVEREKNNGFLRPDAQAIYTKDALRNPSVTLWQASLRQGDGDWSEVLFASEEDLFSIGTDGSFRLNTEAKDLNGEPFAWNMLSPMLPDGFLTMPVLGGE